MKNILFIGLLLFTLSACSDFLKEYSQDLSKVETVSDLGRAFARKCLPSDEQIQL